MSGRPGTSWWWGLEFPQDWVATWALAMSGPVFLAAAVWLAVRLALRLARRRDRTALPRASTLAVLAVLVYDLGFWLGDVLTFLPQDEECGVAREDLLFTSTSVVPLHNRCHLVTGQVVDLVPWWVNPVVGLLVAAAVARTVHARATRTSTESRNRP